MRPACTCPPQRCNINAAGALFMTCAPQADQQRKSNHYKWSETKATKVMAPWLEAKDTADENREVQKRHAVKDERHYIDQLHLKQQRRYRAQVIAPSRLLQDIFVVCEPHSGAIIETVPLIADRAQAHRLMGDLHGWVTESAVHSRVLTKQQLSNTRKKATNHKIQLQIAKLVQVPDAFLMHCRS